MGGCRSKGVEGPPGTERPITTGTGGKGMAGTGGRPAGTGGSKGTGGAAATPNDASADSAGDASVDLVDSAADAPADVVADMNPVPADVRADMMPRDMAVDLPRNLPAGRACQLATQCTSGFCVDGVCCGSACTNPCQACAMAKTGMADGKCATETQMVGQKCGRGCQQFPGQALLVVVDRVCTAAGACDFPVIPQGNEYCTDTDPCTSNSCTQDSAFSARCVKTSKCTGNACCCVQGASRSCTTKTSCTGPGKMCM